MLTIERWVFVGVALQIAETTLNLLGGQVWRDEQNPFLHFSTGIRYSFLTSAFAFFLLWQVNRRKNWARRLLIVCAVTVLPFLPGMVSPKWHPVTHQLLWGFLCSVSVISGLFTVGFSVFLLMPSVRAQFTRTPSSYYRSVLLAGFSAIALLVGFWILGMQNTLKAGKLPGWLAQSIDKKTDKLLSQLQEETNIRIPRRGYVKTINRALGLRIVLMTNIETRQAFAIALAPPEGQVDLAKAFREFDEKFMQTSKKYGTLIQSVVQNRKNTWSSIIPTPLSQEVIRLDGRELRVHKVAFPQDSQYSEGYMNEFLIHNMKIVILSYGKDNPKKALLDFDEEILKTNGTNTVNVRP